MRYQNYDTFKQRGQRIPRRYAIVPCFLACAALPMAAASVQTIENTQPRYVSTARNLGPADPSASMDVTIWLNLHNRDLMDKLAAQLYDRSSPNYRHWLKPADLAANFAPSAEETAAVQRFFVSHNLKVVTVGPNNFFVRARGTVADVQKAFQVQLNNYDVRGQTRRAPASDPRVEGEAAGLVRAVYGLDSGVYTHPLLLRPSSVPGSSSGGAAPSASSGFFTSDCFTGKETQTYNSDGTYPDGTFKGNGYFGSASNPSPGCGYTPSNVYMAYKLSGSYSQGYNGAGQTIAIIDWCGSPTIEKDANAFSKKFGLPALTSSNFQIIQVPIESQCSGADTEINLDVEWSHAIAPGANINLVVPPTASFDDVDEAVSYVVTYGLGTVISGSYASLESETPTTILENENLISEMAAISGMSANFSSGDTGDYSVYGIPPTVSAPADGTYATAVGGVSVALNSDNSIAWQSGWGNDYSLLLEPGLVLNPPFAFGFYGGSGGGPSGYFSKPSFQSGLSGPWRQLPDISWIADPFTGVAVIMSEPGDYPSQVWFAVGGTSVACPMFSALWAIANQEAGGLLGQAAAYLYSMPSSTITDVVPVNSTDNVRAIIQLSSSSTDTYTAEEVIGGASPSDYQSVIWDYPYEGGVVYALSFGTDCTTVTEGFGTLCTSPGALSTGPGWDNVTGLGTPNGQAFADYFKP